jgi:putative SOS response-associated peptidase YedK
MRQDVRRFQGKIAPINAPSESVADKSMFLNAFRERRCLLPG